MIETDSAPLLRRANELYWRSPDTVDQVAEQVGLTRNALYGAIRPEGTGAECPSCGEDLIFPNRSTRSAGRGLCLGCNQSVALDDLPSLERAAASDAEGDAPRWWRPGGRAEAYSDRVRRWREEASDVPLQRAFMIGAAASGLKRFG